VVLLVVALCVPTVAVAAESTVTVNLSDASIDALASSIASSLAEQPVHLSPDTAVLATVTAAPDRDNPVALSGPVAVTPYGLMPDVVPAIVAVLGLGLGWGAHRAFFG